MRWFYKLLEKSSNYCMYAYSLENESYDGLIIYDSENASVSVVSPTCTAPDTEKAINTAIELFYHVINDNFPKQRTVSTG